MELWDAYSKDFSKIEGITLIRGETIPEGMYHLVCDIIVRHTDDTYLLMQRDYRKAFGGMWEASAGGSALKGEDARTAAKRELFEETGIRSDRLTEIGRTVTDENHSLYVCWLCIIAGPKDCIVFQEGETVAYRWVSADDIKSMSKEELVTHRMQQFIDELH